MKYEHQLEDALLRMVALYEGEHDADAPMDKPYWLRRALDSIKMKYSDEVKCPHCGAVRNRGDGFRCCPAAN